MMLDIEDLEIEIMNQDLYERNHKVVELNAPLAETQYGRPIFDQGKMAGWTLLQSYPYRPWRATSVDYNGTNNSFATKGMSALFKTEDQAIEALINHARKR